jgi:Rod binding domain-containing protein
MLVQQLSQSLASTSGLEGGSQEGEAGSEAGGSSSAGTSQLSSLLPQALSSGVMNAGGLGLAAQLTRDLQGTQGVQTQAGGGTSARIVPGAVSPASGGVNA